ncbi:MAG: GntR family transcriptional regulator [Bacteroidetes bacterium]|nr:GntR family transcriptional regulator [Bacteroidota bacterium]
MIEIGKYNNLKILRRTPFGLYLGDESGNDVLLPTKYCPNKFEMGDELKVFVYLDHNEKEIATNIIPKILLHEFAMLQVKDVADVGAFMDWGLEKDLFVPFKEQRQRMKEGRWYIVYLDIDRNTDRLYASNQIEKILQNEDINLTAGEKVDLLVLKETDLGFTVIVNNQHKGLIYENEIFKPLNLGDKLLGYVKNIREDNKIDISLQPIGFENFNDVNTELILQRLSENEGFMAVTDKSSPEEVYSTFGISKKAFKKSLGSLYKQRKISIEPNGIKLT